MAYNWGELSVDVGGEVTGAINSVEEALDALLAILNGIENILDAIEEPAVIIEQVIRAIFDADGFVMLLKAIKTAVTSFIGNLLEADAWLLPIFPAPIARAYIKWQPGPTAISSLNQTATVFVNTFSAPGVQYIRDTLSSALNDVWDPNRPRLGPQAYLGGLVLLIGAETPEDMAVPAELLNAVAESEDIAEFINALTGIYKRYIATDVRNQGSWPDFIRVQSFLDIFPSLADVIRAFQNFLKFAATQDSVIKDIINAVQLAIDLIQYFLDQIQTFLSLLEIIASLKLIGLGITPKAGGTEYVLNSIDNSNDQPNFAYAAGFVLLVGSENPEEVDFVWQIISTLFPVV